MSTKVMKSYLLYGILFSIYLIVALYISDYSGYIIGIIALVCAVIIYFSSGKSHPLSKVNLYIALTASLFFILKIVSTTLFIQYGFLEKTSALFYIFYYVQNMLLFSALHAIMMHMTKQWSRNQMLLDSAFLLYFIVSIIFFMTINANLLIEFGFRGNVIFLAFSSSIVFIFIISTVLINRVIAEENKRVFLGYLFSMLLYILTEIYYFITYVNKIEANLNIAMIFRVLSFVGFAITAQYVHDKQQVFFVDKTDKKDQALPVNFGGTKKVWFVIIIPILLFTVNQITIIQVAFLIVGLLLYQIASYALQRHMAIKLMLFKEADMNVELERRVKERTLELQHIHEALSIKATTDELTGLYNRDYFYNALKKSIEEGVQAFSVLYFDLDRFKIINDLYGHSIADKVLITVANRLKYIKNANTVIARVDDDEFAILYPSVDLDALVQVGKDIVAIANTDIQINEFKFNLKVSVGISRYPQDANSASTLLKHSDLAMYHAKNLDLKEGYFMYSEQIVSRLERRNKIEFYLRNADIEHDFMLYYQPLIDIKTHKIVAVEALLRWKHKTEGFISPREFIPIAEEIGLIFPISKWVFYSALSQIKTWSKMQREPLKIGLNISPILLNLVEFIPMVEKVMQEVDIAPNQIDFEISEHRVMASPIFIEDAFNALHQLGVSISIDDFGRGSSSLGHLKKLCVDYLKIDNTLIENIENDTDSLLIVKAITMMAKGMGIYTVAEGVETQGQLDLLKSIGCDRFQGFIYEPALPASTFEKQHLNLDI